MNIYIAVLIAQEKKKWSGNLRIDKNRNKYQEKLKIARGENIYIFLFQSNHMILKFPIK